MQKIRFSGVQAGTNPYELLINPGEIELNIGGDYSLFETLDDAPVVQRKAFDGRMREMKWPGGLPLGFPDMVLQLAELRSYKGLIKYIHFGSDDGGTFLWYGEPALADTWIKHRIVDVVAAVRQGGRPRYEGITLFFKPEP